MRALRRLVGWLVALAILAVLALVAWAGLRGHPQDLPWTPLHLGEPVGLFTGRRLAGLDGEGARCRALLDEAGIDYTSLPARRDRPECGYDDAVRLRPNGSMRLRFDPAGVGVACPVAAGLAMWDWDVLQPAAQATFGARVVRVEHLGSYNCRRLYGRSTGDWSQHATANAIDVAGFRLSDGTHISVARDWHGEGAKAAFLRRVHDGACGLFSTVLGPDYNAAHRDHFHLDQAPRGATGWRACR